MFFAILVMDDDTTEEVLLSGTQHRELLSGALPLETLALDLDELAIPAGRVATVDVETPDAVSCLGAGRRRVFTKAHEGPCAVA